MISFLKILPDSFRNCWHHARILFLLLREILWIFVISQFHLDCLILLIRLMLIVCLTQLLPIQGLWVHFPSHSHWCLACAWPIYPLASWFHACTDHAPPPPSGFSLLGGRLYSRSTRNKLGISVATTESAHTLPNPWSSILYPPGCYYRLRLHSVRRNTNRGHP